MSGTVLGFKAIVRCDFCGRPQDEVDYLIAAPNGMTHICNDCAATCVELVMHERDLEWEGR